MEEFPEDMPPWRKVEALRNLDRPTIILASIGGFIFYKKGKERYGFR